MNHQTYLKCKQYLILFSLIGLLLSSCRSVKYSMTGASIHPDCKTFSVQYFDNRAPVVNPALSNDFTEALKEKFRSQTNLEEVVNGEGHLNFEGMITGYDVQSIDITKEEIAISNRLTITIRVKYTNAIDDTYDFNTNFSYFEDFKSEQSLSDIEESLIKEILPRIVDDIFNKSVVNW